MSGNNGPGITSKILPPLIISDVNLSSNTSNKYISRQNVITNSLSDGVSTLSDGFLSNLDEPVNPLDIATKNFVDTYNGVAIPNGITGNIQRKNNSQFEGTNNLILNNGVLIVTGTITVGNMTIIGHVLSGLDAPINPTDAVNKAYVDSKTTIFGIKTINWTRASLQRTKLTHSDMKQKIIRTNMSKYLLPL